MSIFILVVNEEELSVPGDNQRCSNYSHNTRHGTFNTYAKYRCSMLGHTVVVNIWNIDVWPRQKYLTPAVSCYLMSLSDQVSYLLDSIVLLSQTIATMISTVKSERNILSFTIEDILKGEFNWNMYEITPPCYVINISILYRLYFKQNDFLKEELIVRRAGLLWSQEDFEWRRSVPLFKCLTVLEFSFILFDLCLLITFFNFIMNYVPIVTFWIFTYHKIWILSIMFCSIWSYWIIYFLACLEVSWRVVS